MTEATDAIASALGCPPARVFWTSGASESNSWALYSCAEAARAKGQVPSFLLSALEHESTWEAAARLGEVIEAPVTPDGVIDLEHVAAVLSSVSVDLASLVAVHNETGVIQPVEEMSRLCRAAGVALHVDYTQALGREPIRLGQDAPDYAVFSSHKIGGPKGVGWLVARGELAPLVAGVQQGGLRGGTENALGAALAARAVSMIGTEGEPFPERLCVLQREFEAGLKRIAPRVAIHGERSRRVRNTTFAAFGGPSGPSGIDGRDLVMKLDLAGICASVGSACGAGLAAPSRALLAMGCTKAEALSSVRFSSGRGTTASDFGRVLAALGSVLTEGALR